MSKWSVRILIVFLGLIMAPALAARAPAFAIVFGLAISVVMALYVLKAPVRRRLNGVLGIDDRDSLVRKAAAVLLGLWAMTSLVGFGIWIAIRGDVGPLATTATQAAAPRVVGSREVPTPPVRVDAITSAAECTPGLVRWGMAIDPDTGEERLYCGIEYKVVAHEDDATPNNIQLTPVIVVAETATKEQLIELLEYEYAKSRAIVMADPREFKEVHVFVYTSERRAKAGNGEWVAKLNATGTGVLPPQASPDFKLPPAGVAKPTALEDEIYDAFWDELNKAGTDDEDARIERQLARRYKKSGREIRQIYTHVNAYRNGG